MAQDTSENNKRIAKNAIMLYIRMFVTMLISLYTSRVVLQVLGVTDYGIYNVVAGVISVIGVMNVTMSTATTRFLAFDLGKSDKESLRNTYGMCLLIFALISAVFVLISESIGLWFLNTQMTIPTDRMNVANIVFQFAVFSGVLGLMRAPYTSLVIAHEDFSFFTGINIAESILKLVICFVIIVAVIDKLAFYSFLMFVAVALSFGVHFFWCKSKYEEATFAWFWDKSLFREILSYSGWNMFGSLSSMAKDTGLNVILNLFFVPAVNAACGIANQVNGVVYQFFASFYNAVNPQIIKYYAQKDMKNMMDLVFKSSRYSFYLILLLSIPIALEAPTLISIWLGQVPEHVVTFIRLIVVITAIDATAYPIDASATATGRIKLYQAVIGIISLLNLPISYLALSAGNSPEIVFVISLCLSIVSFFARLWTVNKVMDFPIKKYLIKVCCTILAVAICAISVPLILHSVLKVGILSTIVICFVSVITTIVVVSIIGMNKAERSGTLRIIKVGTRTQN